MKSFFNMKVNLIVLSGITPIFLNKLIPNKEIRVNIYFRLYNTKNFHFVMYCRGYIPK